MTRKDRGLSTARTERGGSARAPRKDLPGKERRRLIERLNTDEGPLARERGSTQQRAQMSEEETGKEEVPSKDRCALRRCPQE
jgi:hypothetical protein